VADTNLRDDFIKGVKFLLENKATEKGYLAPVGNILMDFMNKEFPDHALGEIVYKAVRYKSKKNPEDLLKIAAWACLIYEWRSK
jgi:hypothetical protein